MEKLALCRMCLARNVPMHLVVKKNLQEMFKQLTAVPFVTDDCRPAVACVMCCARLRNCYEFMNNCLQSEELLQQVLNSDMLTPVTLEQLPSTIKLGNSPVVHTNFTAVLSDKTDIYYYVEGQNSMINDIQVKEEITEGDTDEKLQEIETTDIDPDTPDTIIKTEPENCDFNETNIKSEIDIFESSEEQYLEYEKSGQWSKIDVDSLSEYKYSQDIPLRTKKMVKGCDNISDEKQAAGQVTSLTYKDTTTHKENELTEEKALRNDASECKQIIKHDTSACSSKQLAYGTSQKQDNISNNICAMPGDKRFECDICNKQYNVKGNLVRHFSIHTGDKSYKCNVCNKLFNRKESLVRHNHIHTNDKTFKCKVCSKYFRLRSQLVDHDRIHIGDKPHNCNFCSKCFFQKSDLERHIRKHTGDKPFKCNVCSKCFVQKSDLDRHNRIHTGDRPYKCDVCSKCFVQKYDVVKHIRIHTGYKPYKCNICSKCFTSQSNLVQHTRIHTGDKPYKCNICSKSFTVKSTLDRHIGTHR